MYETGQAVTARYAAAGNGGLWQRRHNTQLESVRGPNTFEAT